MQQQHQTSSASGVESSWHWNTTLYHCRNKNNPSLLGPTHTVLSVPALGSNTAHRRQQEQTTYWKLRCCASVWWLLLLNTHHVWQGKDPTCCAEAEAPRCWCTIHCLHSCGKHFQLLTGRQTALFSLLITATINSQHTTLQQPSGP